MAAARGTYWDSVAMCWRRHAHENAPVASFGKARTIVAFVKKSAVAPVAAGTGLRLRSARVVASQHSNPRIEKFNRRSRFGEPLATTDCAEGDALEALLAADFQAMENLEQEVGGRRALRKVKKVSRVAGANGLDSLMREKVGTEAQSDQQLVRPGGPNHAVPIRTRSGGIKIKSSMAIKLQTPPVGGQFAYERDWEERAYQIIRKQKLRDAAVADANARMTQRPKKELVESNASETVGTGLPSERGRMEDGHFSRMAKCLNLEDRWRPLVEYLHALGLRERDFMRIIDRHKACLQANVNAVKERVQFLLAVGVQFEHLPKLIVRHPQILEYRVEQAMKPRVVYLKSLGLDASKIGKIITISPSLLECSLERSIRPRLSYLMKNVGIKPQDIGKIVTRSPQVLTQSIEDSLQPRVDFFRNEVKLSKEELAKMVTRHPQLLHYSLADGIKPRVKYLRSIGMSDAALSKVLTRLTQILSLSVENCLKPKYDYLVKELKGNVHTVTSFPAYFSLSLDQRIIPRHRYLHMLERTPVGPFPMRLLTISDIAFCKWSKSSVEEYDKFRHDLLLTTFAREFERKNNLRM